jgi:PAS domain S-box-containing protein
MQNAIIYANSAAEMMLGWTKEEMQEKNFFVLVNPTTSTTDGPVDEALAGILKLEALHYIPPLARLSTKSDRTRTVSLKTGIVREESGENRHMLILLQ